MKTNIKSLLVGRTAAIVVAFLAFSFTFGGTHVVRADDPEASSSRTEDMIFVPIAKVVQGLELRLANLELTVASLAQPSQQVTTRQLCVADESGAQTCVTKAQLDALLASLARPVEDNHSQAIAIDNAGNSPSVEAGTPQAEDSVKPAAPTGETGSVKTDAVIEEAPAVKTAATTEETASPPSSVSSEAAGDEAQPEQTSTVASAPSNALPEAGASAEQP